MTLTQADIRRFMDAGCNAAEIGAYAGIPESYAAERMQAVADVRKRMGQKTAAMRRWRAKRKATSTTPADFAPARA